MARSGLFYLRFMDDFLVLSPTRWKMPNPRVQLHSIHPPTLSQS